MPSADITVCASQDCPRRLGCAVHSCHHTWADLAGAVRAGSNFDPYKPGQGGADLAAVSALLGHSSIATTQERYYHLMAGEKARAVALMPQVAAPKAGKLVKIK